MLVSMVEDGMNGMDGKLIEKIEKVPMLQVVRLGIKRTETRTQLPRAVQYLFCSHPDLFRLLHRHRAVQSTSSVAWVVIQAKELNAVRRRCRLHVIYLKQATRIRYWNTKGKHNGLQLWMGRKEGTVSNGME